MALHKRARHFSHEPEGSAGNPLRLIGTSWNCAEPMGSVDGSFGDLVDPPAVELTFPVLLSLDPPVVRGYPPESVIAEKFQAMAVLGIANSRMKDFFDIWTLARSQTRFLEFGPAHRAIPACAGIRQPPA
jgi:hypothetical protein